MRCALSPADPHTSIPPRLSCGLQRAAAQLDVQQLQLELGAYKEPWRYMFRGKSPVGGVMPGDAGWEEGCREPPLICDQ